MEKHIQNAMNRDTRVSHLIWLTTLHKWRQTRYISDARRALIRGGFIKQNLADGAASYRRRGARGSDFVPKIFDGLLAVGDLMALLP